jgi:hypothetical protein
MVLIWLLLLFTSEAQAFVLLSGPIEARLPVNEGNPRITFELSTDPPPITDKDEFMGGAYSDLSDSDFWLTLVQLAVAPWNAVADAYVELDFTLSDTATIAAEDGIFSIAAGATNLTTGAYADPRLTDSIIVDCDITVSKRGNNARFMAYTLMHELGHCLGLGHNHGDYSAVMGYARTDLGLHLGLDDEAGLVYLYPLSSVGKPKELAGCGIVGGKTKGSWVTWLLFLIPIVMILLRRAWIKNPSKA